MRVGTHSQHDLHLHDGFYLNRCLTEIIKNNLSAPPLPTHAKVNFDPSPSAQCRMSEADRSGARCTLRDYFCNILVHTSAEGSDVMSDVVSACGTRKVVLVGTSLKTVGPSAIRQYFFLSSLFPRK